MTILALTANASPVDGNSLYAAPDSHVSTGHIDAYINESLPANNYGAAPEIAVLDYSGGDEQRSLLKFNMSSLPAGATITSAHLQLYIELINSGVNATLGAYGLLRDWAEGTGDTTESGDGATWNTYDGVNSWGTAGAKNTSTDVDAAAQDTSLTGTSTGAWVSWDVTDWVQDVADSVRSNYGLLVARTTLLNDAQYVNFSSREDGTEGQLPELWIEYSVPVGPTFSAGPTVDQITQGGARIRATGDLP